MIVLSKSIPISIPASATPSCVTRFLITFAARRGLNLLSGRPGRAAASQISCAFLLHRPCRYARGKGGVRNRIPMRIGKQVEVRSEIGQRNLLRSVAEQYVDARGVTQPRAGSSLKALEVADDAGDPKQRTRSDQ